MPKFPPSFCVTFSLRSSRAPFSLIRLTSPHFLSNLNSQAWFSDLHYNVKRQVQQEILLLISPDQKWAGDYSDNWPGLWSGLVSEFIFLIACQIHTLYIRSFETTFQALMQY